MKTITLVLALILVACTRPAPQQPQSAPTNLACAQVQSLDPQASCLPMRTAAPGLPDVALAEAGGGLLVRCTVGAGCAVIADLRPKAPEQAKAEPAPQSTATPSPATADAAPAAPAPTKAKK